MTTKKSQILTKFYEESIAKCEQEKKKYQHIPMAGAAIVDSLNILIDHSKEQLEQIKTMEETQ